MFLLPTSSITKHGRCHYRIPKNQKKKENQSLPQTQLPPSNSIPKHKICPNCQNPTKYANQIGYLLTPPFRLSWTRCRKPPDSAKANRYGANQKSAIGGNWGGGGGKVIDYLIRHALKQVVPPHSRSSKLVVVPSWSLPVQSHREILYLWAKSLSYDARTVRWWRWWWLTSTVVVIAKGGWILFESEVRKGGFEEEMRYPVWSESMLTFEP